MTWFGKKGVNSWMWIEWDCSHQPYESPFSSMNWHSQCCTFKDQFECQFKIELSGMCECRFHSELGTSLLTTKENQFYWDFAYHEGCKDHSIGWVRWRQHRRPEKNENVHAGLNDSLQNAEHHDVAVLEDLGQPLPTGFDHIQLKRKTWMHSRALDTVRR